jgi:hypothetical protein
LTLFKGGKEKTNKIHLIKEALYKLSKKHQVSEISLKWFSTENQKQILIKTFNNLNMVKLRNEINELTNKLHNIQLRKNNSDFNDINMIQPIHSFNDNQSIAI